MPRSTISNRRDGLVDAKLLLRDIASASAISATTSEPAVAIDLVAFDALTLVLTANSYTGYVATTAQWDVSVEVSTTSGGTYTSLRSVTLNGTKSRYDIPIGGLFAQELQGNPQYIRVTATKTGSPGTLNYGAYLADTDAD